LVAECKLLEPPDAAVSPRRFYWIRADVKYEAALYPCYSMSLKISEPHYMAFWPSWSLILVLLLHCVDLSWLVPINPHLLCSLYFIKDKCECCCRLFYIFIIATKQILPTKISILH
jgi:hypothetical protein